MSGKGQSAQTKARETAIIHEIAPQPRKGPSSVSPGSVGTPAQPQAPESFVTAKEAASFLCLTVRRVLELARSSQLPAHPIGGSKRRTWRFRLSELAQAITVSKAVDTSATIFAGSPSVPGQEK